MTETAIHPEIADRNAQRGRSLLAAGQDAAAPDAFQRAAWLAPDIPHIPRMHWAAGNVRRRLGRGEESVASYQRAIELLSDKAAPHCHLAELCAVLGRLPMPNFNCSTHGHSPRTIRICTWPMPLSVYRQALTMFAARDG